MSYQAAIGDSDLIDGLSVRCLKICGIWKAINDCRTTGKINYLIKLQIIFTLMLATPFVFCQWLSYFVITVDIQKAMFLNLHMLTALQVCVKMIVFWFRMDSISKLYNLARKDFLSIPKNRISLVKEAYKKISKSSNIFCTAVLLAIPSSNFMSLVDPWVPVDYIAHHTGDIAAVTGGKKKILGGWYPVPMADSPYYEIIFIYEATSLVYAGILLGVYIGMFYQLLMCLHAQFLALGLHISTLKIVNNHNHSNNNVDSNNSEMYKELYTILLDHKKLLSSANELRSVYNPLVTVVLEMGMFLLIIVVFQFLFGTTVNFSFLCSLLGILAYQLIEVFMFCSGSSSIEQSSSDLQFAIYSSDWYKADIKFRKTAQMVMVRAGKGETLIAFRMYPVNMETIMSIMQFTYSFASMMSRMT